ncbi:hypothetical protein Btru_032464 [Bulinus truncatus]|nr:hypothetical protein Btru_032464 [Bulinus truncatus]
MSTAMNDTTEGAGSSITYTKTQPSCNDVFSSVQVKISCGIDLYLPPFLFIFGVISNVLVIIVMRSRHFRSNSSSVYMVAGALADTASLLVNLPAHYIFVNFHMVFHSVLGAHYLCSFFNIFGWSTSDLGILFTVAMTTDRAIAVRFPLKASKLCSTRRALYVVLGLILFELVKLWHMITESRITASSTSRLCDVSRDNPLVRFYVTSVYPWFHITILTVSYVVALAENFIIIQSIKRSRSPTCVTNRRKSRVSTKNSQLSLMLVVDSLALIICTLPFSIVNALISQFNLLPDTQEGKNLAFTSAFYLLYLNRCLNLLLYGISGRRFRGALKNILCSSPSQRNFRDTVRADSIGPVEPSGIGPVEQRGYDHQMTPCMKTGSLDKGDVPKDKRLSPTDQRDTDRALRDIIVSSVRDDVTRQSEKRNVNISTGVSSVNKNNNDLTLHM